MKPLFKGAYVAIITPFKQDGKVDARALEKFVRWQIEEGTDGIVCCGATGESVVLNDREKKQIARICIETAQNQIPIVVGTGSPSTSQTVKLTEEVQRLGAAGALVVTPFYNKPTAQGCIAHYREIARVGLPLIPYYNPKRTACYLEPKTIQEIGTIPGIVALKDSSGDMELIRFLRKNSPLPILSGDDDCNLDAIRNGAIGAISVIGNIFPRIWKKMIDLALNGELNGAKALNERYFKLCKAMFLETNPQCIKWTASWFGKSPKYLRLPLLEPEESSKQVIRRLCVELALPQFQTSQVRSINAE